MAVPRTYPVRRRSVVKAAVGGGVLLSAATLTAADAAAEYTEHYQGRRITVAGTERQPLVRVDGRPLHVMRLSAGKYLSALCHYEFAPTPLAAARRAVEELRGAQLLPQAPGHVHGGEA